MPRPKPLFAQLIHMAPRKLLDEWARDYVRGFQPTKDRRALEQALIGVDNLSLRDEVLAWVRLALFQGMK